MEQISKATLRAAALEHERVRENAAAQFTPAVCRVGKIK
jgi:hypothetical protein